MKITRLLLTAFGLATTIAISACYCGVDDQHAVTISSLDSLTILSGGVTRRIGGAARLTDPPTNTTTLGFVYSTIEGSTGGEGISLTFSGPDPKSDELVAITLALPVSLRNGDQYSVGRTFAIEPGFTTDPREFGAYDLQQPNQAEASFFIATYTFPPATFTTNFRAVTSAGTVRVTQRERGRLELSLNLNFTDATGKTATVTGRIQLNSEQYSRPCN